MIITIMMIIMIILIVIMIIMIMLMILIMIMIIMIFNSNHIMMIIQGNHSKRASSRAQPLPWQAAASRGPAIL